MCTPLTQKQVDDLQEGVHVTVKWSGGNGPHEYVVHLACGMRAATHRGIHVGFLVDVGRHPLTQVWLA